MRIKLNGWHRIGIVVSVIWFIGFAWSSLYQETRVKEKYGECLHISEMAEGRVDEKVEKCLAEWQRLDKSILADLGKIGVMDKRILLAIDFGTVILGWLIVWCGIVVIRWIRRGFA
jgi:hypothetical protein